MEYLGFFALIALGTIFVAGAALVLLVVFCDGEARQALRQTTKSVAAVFAVIVAAPALSGLFFIYQAYVHAPFEILSR